MKKLITTILFLGVLGFTACDLDIESPDSIPYDKGFTDMGAVEALERGAYSRLRTTYSLNSMLVPDLQADYAHAIYGFSNTYGQMYLWNFAQDATEVTNTWNDLYGGISLYNFILDGISYNLKFEPTDTERTKLDRIMGRMYLMRALSYSLLAERFCGDYNEATAKNEHTGLPLVTAHNSSKTPPRSTLYDVYEQILRDLTEARNFLRGQSGSASATTVNIDCVTALEARVYLQMDNYAEALNRANSLIGNSTYSLVSSVEELKQMWTYDKSPETIFQFYASKTEVAYQWGYSFISDYYNGVRAESLMMPDYIPTQACVDKFDTEDWRRKALFLELTLGGEIDGRVYLPYVKGRNMFASNMVLFNKYPGNPDLRTSSTWNYYNTFKVFRLAEMYLIAAEAAVQSGGDAKTPLNKLRSHRGLPALSSVTLADVQDERYREMMLEGTRLTDLKRWGMDLKRGAAQESETSADGGNPWYSSSIVTELGSDIEKPKGDYMFVWPIPASEIFANPQLASQQNPGWVR